jgi:carbon storage regulator CsrA
VLVLSRKTNESVVVGSADGLRRLLTVTVLEIRHGSVRLGFAADDDMPIHRSEVWDRLGGQQGGPHLLPPDVPQCAAAAPRGTPQETATPR